jgi:hypothetical protein
MEKEVVEMGEILITMRPDLPPVKDLLLLSQVFASIFPREASSQAIAGLANFVHCHHFLAFYRGDKSEIELRIQLFENLLEINAPSVRNHFRGIRLETRMYLVTWFLSIFSSCFQGEFLLRIWDNFVLEGELYLFRVGIALVKYYEIELKMCTFNEGLKMLKFTKNTSPTLFFHILEEEIDVKEHYYDEYIEKRKHAIIKTKVQSIPLE